MFSRQTIEDINSTALRLGVEPAAMLAVAEVESGGKTFARVNGREEPLIRFEGHYFDRRLSGEKRDRARQAGLANPAAGKVANPSTQSARWTLLRRAAAVDRQAAYESVSWGVGQVMGAHWAWLGYTNVDALVAEARRSVAGQIELMARYIEKAGLVSPLRRHDWAAFARGYNGPDYKRHGYDRKIAAAYARYARLPPRATVDPPAIPTLARGATGPDVVDLQTMLIAAGQTVARDGIFGLETQLAIRRFQTAQGLDADGIAGPLTMAALSTARGGRHWWRRMVDWIAKIAI